MPLPGGASDKYGNRYEGHWAVECLLDVLSGSAIRIRFEPPGEEGRGVEFRVDRESGREYWQVKRQQNGKSGWTLADLADVLKSFWDHIGSSRGACCVFASTQGVAHLPELTDRATHAADVGEFLSQFLNSGDLRRAFDTLLQLWKAEPPQAYETLRNITCRTVDEESLIRSLRAKAESRLNGDPASIVDVLAAYAFESVNAEVPTEAVRSHLESRGIHNRVWTETGLQASIDQANNAYLNPLRQAAIHGDAIPRAEAQQLVDVLLRPGGDRCLVVTGHAGVGKSGVLLEVINDVQDRGWPVLAMRVDQLEPVPVPSGIGAQLGFHASPPIVLEGVAQGRDALLVIDQVDAVSLASGRHPEFLNCVLEMVHQAALYGNLRVVVSARSYDTDNDPRLKRLIESGEGVSLHVVDVLDIAQTRRVLGELGMLTEDLTDLQIGPFRLPLYLSLLAQGGSSPPEDLIALSTSARLFERFWDYKSRLVSLRLGRDARWTEVVDRMTDDMSRRQRLFVSEATLDDLSSDVHAMASEHVVTVSAGRISFFHQAFFDYVFARRFLARSGDVIEFLLQGEQHLFRRTQVRAVLELQRDHEFADYCANLARVTTSKDLRYHVRRAVFDLLGGVSAPTSAEWAIVESQIADPDDPDSVWRLLGNPAWFRIADGSGVIERWASSSDDDLIDRTVQLLRTVQRSGDEDISDRVARILGKYIGQGDRWDTRLRWVMVWGDVGASRVYFDLFIELLSRGVLDDGRGPIAINSDFWSLVYGLPKRHPTWAAELVGAYLRRRSELARSTGTKNPFAGEQPLIPDSQVTDVIFKEIVDGDPSTLAAEIIPWIIETARTNRAAQNPSDGFARDDVWSFLFVGWGHTFAGQLFAAAERSLQAISAADPEAVRPFIEQLTEDTLTACHHLAMRAYAANSVFSDEAVDYLLRMTGFSVGYIDADSVVTRDLVRAVTVHCSDQRLKALEARLLGYYPPWERSLAGRSSFGHAQFVLLSAISLERRSGEVSRRIAERERRFGSSVAQIEPRELEVSWVPPPIPPDAAEKMTDDQWIAAILRYNTDTLHHRTVDDVFGGSHELAQVLRERAKAEPSRFARLLERVPDSASTAYFDAVLGALGETDAEVEIALAACRRCHALSPRPCGAAMCRVISRFSTQPLPADILEIVGWYATEDPDPTSEAGNVWGGDERDSARDILDKAINCVRGEAAETLGALVLGDSARLPLLLPAITAVSNDPLTIVRTTAAHAVLDVMRCERDLSLALLLQLTDSPDDRLLKTHYVERLVYSVLGTDFGVVEPIIQRMISSNDAETAETGARLACIAALTIVEAFPLSRACLDKGAPPSIRRGAASIFAANLGAAHLRAECDRALRGLFQDPDSSVRGAAAQCFRGLTGNELAPFGDLIEDFAESPAFAEHHFDLLRALDVTTARMPKTICEVCERFVEVVGAEAGDIRTATSAHADIVCRLTLRVYSTTYDPDLQHRSLNVIDKMMRYNYYGLAQAIGAYSDD